jgi:RNA-directed DNA polymerase
MPCAVWAGRPGRRAHHTVKAAQRDVAEGRRELVDLDQQQCFDRVNPDILMGKLAGKIGDAGERKPSHTTAIFNPVPRGRAAYFKLAQSERCLEAIDGWSRRKLRCILWRPWKRTCTCVGNLMKDGLAEERAWRSTTNGRGACWNSAASHRNAAIRKAFFDRPGLASLLDTARRLQCLS